MTLNILANNSAALILAAVTLLFGGIVAAIRLPGLKLLRWHQHFAAGIVLAAVCIGLLSSIQSWRAPLFTLAGFMLGTITILVIKLMASKTRPKPFDSSTQRIGPVSLWAKTLMCSFLFGLTMMLEAEAKVALEVAMTTEVLFLLLLRAAAVKPSTPRLILVALTMTLLFLAGALVGNIVFRLSMDVWRFALFFVAGAVSYLVMHELLVAVRDRQQPSALAGIFCLGFFAVIVIDVIA